MMNKRYTKLSDIVEIISGGTPKTSVPEYWDGSIPWLAVNDFAGDSRWVYSAEKSVTELGVQKSATKVLNKGDLILSARGTVGELAELAVPMAFNQSCFGLRGKNNTDTEYLYYLLKFNMPKIQVVANGATFGTIVLDTFDRIKLESLDDLNVQQKIANILSRYDEAIENNSKRIKLLEQMAQNLYKEWFVRFRFPGYEKCEFENGMPKGWKVEKLGNLYDTTSGGTPSREHEEYYQDGVYPWIKTGELKDQPIIDTEEKITEEALKHSSAKLFKKDSLIIAMYGATIGQLGINKMDATCNQACCVIKPKIDKTFGIYHLFNYFKENRDFIVGLGNGAAQQNLSQDLIKKLKVLNPSKEILKLFEEEETVFFEQIYILQKKNQNLANQRDLLLPRLMSGKLEV